MPRNMFEHLGTDRHIKSVVCKADRGYAVAVLRHAFGEAVSISKCNKVKFISPVSVKVKSVFRKEEFGWAFPV